ncbi:hypothetical protein C3941_10100 [Kaistia algarum]|uniref:hypothetical protein n=1 Tax=Kaistia algarum TaxID=2083279 RepID=UPI000CE8F4C8|nr:hypothetical protein [Kaistia algarum]MCX5512410.1 hypothetical protein [Kaistia algarum]PPE80490.1 hypothetical protein C3941_10100 [Kaistia algarum]
MESDEGDNPWWRADAQAVAGALARAVRSLTRADLIFTAYLLVLWSVWLFVWPATPVASLTFLSFAVRLFIRPERAVRAVEKRMAEDDDRYFEEQRALRAYPVGTARQVRQSAAFMIVLCLMWSASEVQRFYVHDAERRSFDTVRSVGRQTETEPVASVNPSQHVARSGETRVP